jgi:hypothetical protein
MPLAAISARIKSVDRQLAGLSCQPWVDPVEKGLVNIDES